MADLNKIVVVGRLVRNPEAKKAGSGKIYCTFTIASDTYAKEKKTNFFDCICGNENAVNLLSSDKWFNRGDPIAVDGELDQVKWTGKDGKNHKDVRINVRNVYFLPKTKAGEENENVPQVGKDSVTVENIGESDKDLPF